MPIKSVTSSLTTDFFVPAVDGLSIQGEGTTESPLRSAAAAGGVFSQDITGTNVVVHQGDASLVRLNPTTDGTGLAGFDPPSHTGQLLAVINVAPPAVPQGNNFHFNFQDGTGPVGGRFTTPNGADWPALAAQGGGVLLWGELGVGWHVLFPLGPS